VGRVIRNAVPLSVTEHIFVGQTLTMKRRSEKKERWKKRRQNEG